MRRTPRIGAASLATVASVAFRPVLALAAEGGHHEPHGVPWAFLAFSTVNLAIFLAIMARYLWPGIRDTVRTRRSDVVELLQKASAAKAESERLQKEWQARLANLDSELETLRRQAAIDIAAERERILEAAKRVAEAIRRDATRAAEQEVRNAEATLRHEVAAQALRIARRLAPERIGANDQRRFVAEFLQQVRP